MCAEFLHLLDISSKPETIHNHWQIQTHAYFTISSTTIIFSEGLKTVIEYRYSRSMHLQVWRG